VLDRLTLYPLLTLVIHMPLLTPFKRRSASFLSACERHQSVVIALGLTGLSLKCLASGLWFQSFCFAMLLGFLYPLQLDAAIRRTDRFCQAYRLNLAMTASFSVALVVVGVVMLGGMHPADAQFFVKTEQWMVNSSGLGVDKTISGLIFNTLRLVFVIYLGISLVKVVNSAREGDDWQTLARTPAIILLAVSLGDALGTYITSGSGSGASTTGK